MKNLFLVIVAIALISCKQAPKKSYPFPDEIQLVFEKHGGIEGWKTMQALSFKKGEEMHSVDLSTRKTKVVTPNYSLGFDGQEVWLKQDSSYFKGNKDFYHNLYFYFYAMPFVLADDGITYEKSDSITYKGVTYPSIKISYGANVGSSPDDNYKIYYHPETYKMEWLAYTVTFNSKKPSERYNLIRYNKWTDVNGFVLPNEITWYKKDADGNPTEPARAATIFSETKLSNVAFKENYFDKPME